MDGDNSEFICKLHWSLIKKTMYTYVIQFDWIADFSRIWL